MASRPFSVCVFCSSSSAIDPRIQHAAREFAEGLVSRQWTLVYGGGMAGLMGHFADCTLASGGQVVGIIPTCLHDQCEIAHEGLTRLEVVSDLFDRKRRMMQESDAFVIFPGGWGTLDEALEVLTWKALQELNKPIYFVNLNGFWTRLLEVFRDFTTQGMLRPEALQSFEVTTNVPDCLSRLERDASRL